MRNGKGKGWLRGWTCRHEAKARAARQVRHAVRQILRTLDHYTLEAIPFPAPVGGWWDMPCEVIDTRFPREVLLVNRFEGEDYYPAEPVVPLYPDLADLSKEAWSRFDHEDDDGVDYARDVGNDVAQDQIRDYLDAQDCGYDPADSYEPHHDRDLDPIW